MGREVKRVPLSFDWPLGEAWDGYLMPKRLGEKKCETCDGGGYSPEAERLKNRWYGYVPFDPAETGSTPFTVEAPEVRAFAERNVGNSPDFYGTGEAAILREAKRLADLWNRSWSHHLHQRDVDVLLAEGRLREFAGQSPTAAEVNLWSLGGFGHDSINQWIVVRAECERLGVAETCAACGGHGSVERWPGQRAEAEAWERIEPPTGEGWQMWETTSEGSPSSPVFETPEGLADYCAANVSVFGSSMAPREQWLSIITGEDFAHVQITPGVVLM